MILGSPDFQALSVPSFLDPEHLQLQYLNMSGVSAFNRTRSCKVSGAVLISVSSIIIM